MNAYEAILGEVCGSDARFRVLRALDEQPDRELHLRRLAATAQVDPGNASKLLTRLARAGFVLHCRHGSRQRAALAGEYAGERAVIALAPFEGPDVVAALTAALDDRDWQVRQGAAP